MAQSNFQEQHFQETNVSHSNSRYFPSSSRFPTPTAAFRPNYRPRGYVEYTPSRNAGNPRAHHRHPRGPPPPRPQEPYFDGGYDSRYVPTQQPRPPRRERGGGYQNRGSGGMRPVYNVDVVNWQRNSPLLSDGGNRRNYQGTDGYSTGNSQDVRKAATESTTMSRVPAQDVSESRIFENNARFPQRAGAVSRGGKSGKIEDKNQRERLIEELTKQKLECQICCEAIFRKQETWSCDSCYNIFHLKCLRGWATTCKKESEDSSWRCMICQVTFTEVPRHSICFCHKQESPEYDPNITPHSCGQVCGKGSAKGNAGLGCEHPCVCLCHPGPCPPCQRSIPKSCGCGKTQIQDQCSSNTAHVCSNTCDKLLDCGQHTCKDPCHIGSCQKCDVSTEQVCFCGGKSRILSCLDSSSSMEAGFSCAEVCGRDLECGNHQCARICHRGKCAPCVRSPEMVTRCACGKHLLREIGGQKRESCLDAVASCGDICGKVLTCGTVKSPHICEEVCHDGNCGTCGKKTAVNCSCGSSTQVVPCSELTAAVRAWKCPKKCQKKMTCGRHKCDNVCCNFDEHICLRPCGKKLTCGLHVCEDPCGHPGACRRCYNTSFQERACLCGFTVQHPPIPCGAPLPDCNQLCTRPHPCGHPPTHNCHGDPDCPQCTFLCEKTCFGDHTTYRNIPCHVTGLSCGKACGKMLPCGVHGCKKFCHAGECQGAGEKCVQLCPLVNRKCGHPCAMACHGEKKCPVTPCKSQLEVTCECKLRKERIVCQQHEKLLKEYLRKLTADGGSKGTNLDDLRFALPRDVLECDDECRKVERNAKMASALHLDEVPEHNVITGPPVYGESLKQFARENLRWATQIETSIIALIKTLKESSASCRMHQFQPMKFEQRKFVHELASFYGCGTQSYDQEPIRSIVVVAKLDSAEIPSTPLHQLISAERPAKQTAKFPSSVFRGLGQSTAVPAEKPHFSWPVDLPTVKPAATKTQNEPVIDYFDVTE